MSCHSTPFLWCLPKETVSSRQRKAPFYLGGSTIRVSAPASVVVTHLRPTLGRGLVVVGGLCVCAVSLGGCRCSLLPFDPISFVLPKETVSSRQRKALFYPGGSTIRVSASASVVVTHLRPTWGGTWWLTGRSSQLDAVGCDVGASSPWERRAGPNSSRGGTQKRVSLGLHPVSLRKSKEMGWNWQ